MLHEELKRRAAAKAIDLVTPGMKLGLGTGSTAALFVELLGERVKAGLEVVCVPTSAAIERQARAAGLRLASLDEEPFLDLTVDGADEIDPELRLIKGGGGALLREKIVATASYRMAVIADASKQVAELGRFPLPIEVVRFGLEATRRMIADLAADCGAVGKLELRRGADGAPYQTDGGNLILDGHFGRIPEPEELALSLQMVPGVVEHGLFIGLADLAIISGPDGVRLVEATGQDGA